MFYHGGVDEDLIRLRRSLAMAPSLPGDAAARLLDEVEELRRKRRDLTFELGALADYVRQLRARVDRGEQD
jgi:hypothetical protein